MELIKPDSRAASRFTPTVGVYAIVHHNSMKWYIGSSKEVERRIYNHITMLKAGKHGCRHLQRTWDKYGETGFDYFLLERCSEDQLITREQEYLDNPQPYWLFNARPKAEDNRGFKHSEETKKRQSEAAKRVALDVSERARRRELAKAQHRAGNFGRATWKTRK